MTTTDERSLRVVEKLRRRRERESRRAMTMALDDDDDDDDDPYYWRNNSHDKSVSSRLCELDVIDWKESILPHQDLHRKNRRRQLGERLIRKKACTGGITVNIHDNSSNNNIDNNNNNNNTSQPNTELIHRKKESFSSQAYTKCSFLDTYDKVLAVDCNGALDIFRLADIRKRDDKKKSSPAHKIATELELGSILPIDDYSAPYIQPLAGGSVVAMGLQDDSLLLLDLGQTPFPILHDLIPIPIANNNPSHFRAWMSQSPRRKYYRDRHNPHLTLLQLANNQLRITNAMDTSELQTIYSNSQGSHQFSRFPNHIRFVPSLHPANHSRWDICSVQHSVLNVAHVDQDFDAFWIQILDGRVMQNNKCNTKRRPMIIVDSSSQDLPGKKEEHVTACALLSDICLATAHISCPNYGLTPAREFFDRDLPFSGYGMETCVKLWDLRMMTSSTAGTRSINPANIIPTPFFPEADSTILEPAECILTQLTRKVKGGPGDDKLLGAGGNDLLLGGADNDTYIFVPATSRRSRSSERESERRHRHVELWLSDDQCRGESGINVSSASSYESYVEAEFRSGL